MTTFVLLALLALAVREDVLWHRIPNRVSAATLCTGLALSLLQGGMAAALASVGGVLVAGGVLLPFYLAGKLGAGDVKLMAGVGAFLTPMDALLAAAVALMAGAALALGILSYRALQAGASLEGSSGSLECPAAWRAVAAASVARKERFPYAAAIAVGALMVMAGVV